jgi:hypothetical protein
LETGEIWDNALRQMLVDETVTASDVAHRLGVDVKTMQRHAARLGLLRESWKVSLKRAGHQARHEKALAMHRANWVTLRERHPAASRRELQSFGKGSYEFLIKHDANWLQAHMPPVRPRKAYVTSVNWHVREDNLLRQVHEVIVAARLKRGKPARISRTLIGRKLGFPISGALLAHMPRLAAYLPTVVETRANAARRRLLWAEMRFIVECRLPSWREFLRRAGLGERTFVEIRFDAERAYDRLRQSVGNGCSGAARALICELAYAVDNTPPSGGGRSARFGIAS